MQVSSDVVGWRCLATLIGHQRFAVGSL